MELKIIPYNSDGIILFLQLSNSKALTNAYISS